MKKFFQKYSWRGFTNLPLAIEITLALLCKMVVLWLLWQACFSAPQTKKMRLPTSQVEQHLLSLSALINPPFTTENHDSR